MTTFSHSRIGTFETCPLQYKFHYIDRVKVEQEDTVEAFLGSRVHEALEKLYKDMEFEKQLSLKELLGFFNREWDEKELEKVRKFETAEKSYRFDVRKK